MQYYIAIPSYKRAEKLKAKTLSLLERYSIDPGVVYIFVADKQEYEVYRKALPDKWQNIVVARPGVVYARNFIQDYFAEGDRVVCMDDDIEGIEEKVNDKKTKPLDDLNKFILYAWELCDKYKCGLWGVYPVFNPYFMKRTITLDLKFCWGGFFGLIIARGMHCSPDSQTKEDYELTIKYFLRDGRVLRFNYIAAKTKVYSGTGGCNAFDRKLLSKQAAEYLIKTYPMFVEYNKSRKSGFVEIKLIDKTKRRSR